MIKKNFCLVGVEYDFDDLTIDYKNYFLIPQISTIILFFGNLIFL